MKQYCRVHADIYLDRIVKNIENAKKLIAPNTKIMAIVKSDGYGHGAVPVAKALDHFVDAYGVAIIEEALELREANIQKPILILGYVPEQYMEKLVTFDIIPAIFTLDMAKALSNIAKKHNKMAKIHIKLDTGMGRIGFALTEESLQTIKEISNLPNICIDGCFSHFSCADEKDLSFAKEQLSHYDTFVQQIEDMGISIPMKHISNSAGIMELPEANKNMVRSGITTYGLYPSEEVEKERLALQPAMELKSYISFVKTVEAGVGVSYNRTYITDSTRKIATIPVGYGDGYPRALSSKGRVLIKGRYASIVGRICMDQFMVDVTDLPDVQRGDQVTLIGKDGNHEITVEEIGALSHSFNYEVVCDIGKRIPRIYYQNGKRIASSETRNWITYDTEE